METKKGITRGMATKKRVLGIKMQAFRSIGRYKTLYLEGMISVKELRDLALYTAQQFGLSLESKYDPKTDSFLLIIHTPFTDGEIIKVADMEGAKS